MSISKSRVVPDADGVFFIAVLSVNELEVTLQSRTMVGQVEEMGKTVCEVRVNRMSSVIDQIQFGESLTSTERKEAEKLVKKYERLFTKNSKKPKQTNLVKHRIITNNALPVKSKYRRIPVAWEKEVESQVQEMLQTELFVLRLPHGTPP